MLNTPQAEYNPATLFAKLAKVMGAISRLKKTGTNNDQNYKFVTDADLLDTIRPLLAEQNIALIAGMTDCVLSSAGTTKNGVPKTHAQVTFDFTLCCGDSGVTYTCKWVGEAIDMGDKVISKAATSALKYWLLKTFMVSTGDSKDDADAHSYTRAPKQQPQRPTQPPPPAPAQTNASASNSSAPAVQDVSTAESSKTSENAQNGQIEPKTGNPEPKRDTDKINYVWKPGMTREFHVASVVTKPQKRDPKLVKLECATTENVIVTAWSREPFRVIGIPVTDAWKEVGFHLGFNPALLMKARFCADSADTSKPGYWVLMDVQDEQTEPEKMAAGL